MLKESRNQIVGRIVVLLDLAGLTAEVRVGPAARADIEEVPERGAAGQRILLRFSTSF